MSTEGETTGGGAIEPGDYLSHLRAAADALEAAPRSGERSTFFPNWPFDENELDNPEVTRAHPARGARGIRAQD